MSAKQRLKWGIKKKIKKLRPKIEARKKEDWVDALQRSEESLCSTLHHSLAKAPSLGESTEIQKDS